MSRPVFRQSFPVFANRVMPRSRPEFDVLAMRADLAGEADPFEVLARAGGRRAAAPPDGPPRVAAETIGHDAPPNRSVPVDVPPTEASADPCASDPLPAVAPIAEHEATDVAASRLRIGLLGSVDLPRGVVGRLRPKEVQMLAFLATQGERSVTNDDIRAALGQGSDEDPSADTVRTYLSRIRAAVGSEVLPEAVERRYRLANLEVDLARFDQLCAEASAADPAETRIMLTDALKLVRGRPFADVDVPWTSMITARLERQIADAAQRLALLSREARDHDATRWAAERGLAGLTQPDARLLGFLLYVGAAHGPSALTHAWSEVIARCAAVGDVPSQDLVALYDQLRIGQQRF